MSNSAKASTDMGRVTPGAVGPAVMQCCALAQNHSWLYLDLEFLRITQDLTS